MRKWKSLECASRELRKLSSRNLLAAFGFFLFFAGGQLLAAYLNTADPVRAFLLMIALIVCVLGLVACFCYMAVWRTRELTPHPGESLDEAREAEMKPSSLLGQQPPVPRTTAEQQQHAEQERDQEESQTERETQGYLL